MRRNEYTQEFKKEAVALSNREGIKVRPVALELGIKARISVPMACRDALQMVKKPFLARANLRAAMKRSGTCSGS